MQIDLINKDHSNNLTTSIQILQFIVPISPGRASSLFSSTSNTLNFFKLLIVEGSLYNDQLSNYNNNKNNNNNVGSFVFKSILKSNRNSNFITTTLWNTTTWLELSNYNTKNTWEGEPRTLKSTPNIRYQNSPSQYCTAYVTTNINNNSNNNNNNYNKTATTTLQ